MCEGFGTIVSNELKVYFIESDYDGNVSHSEILKRLGWTDNTDPHLRHFVRTECADWKIKSFRFDEEDTLPGWAEENRQEIINLVGKTLKKVYPALAEYKKVRDPAWAEYKKVRDQAWAELGKSLSTISGYVGQAA